MSMDPHPRERGTHEVVSEAGSRSKIEVSRATKVYEARSGSVHALQDVTFAVEDGEFICIVGPSGCGKTTLLWAMSGLHGLTDGEVRLDGTPVNGPRKEEIGLIFQEANLLPWRNLQQNIEFPFEIRRLPVAHDRISELLQVTGLSGFEGSFPRELSGGMQQRASIVRALAQDPSVLLMDEPFGALDAFTRDEMNLLLLKLWAEHRKTIVFITHTIHEAAFLGDKVIVMSPRPGRISKVFPIDLPRPRTVDMMFDPDFIELTRQIKTAVEEGSKQNVELT